jgi:hypothetical protein
MCTQANDFGFLGLNCFTIFATQQRAAASGIS